MGLTVGGLFGAAPLPGALLANPFSPPCSSRRAPRVGAVLSSPLDGAVCERCWAERPLASAAGSRGRSHEHFSAVTTAVASRRGHRRVRGQPSRHHSRAQVRRPPIDRAAARRADARRGADVLRGRGRRRAGAAAPAARAARGFNQADDLARALGPARSPLLRRTRSTHAAGRVCPRPSGTATCGCVCVTARA